MTRLAIIVTVAAGLLALPAGAQDQSTTTSLSDRTPQENAGAGQVRGRSPGTWVRAAVARHNGLMNQRLTGPRFGQPNTEEAELRFRGNGSTGSTSGFGGLADLLSLATQFTSGTSTGGLADLIGNLAGGSTGSTTGSASGTTSGGSVIPPPANGTEYTLEDLIALGQQYGGTQKTINTSSKLVAGESVSKNSAYQERSGRVFGGAIARLPKAEDRFQSNDTVQETPFRIRWANAMLQSFFSALTLGLQSQQFIDSIKDVLRPIMIPPANTSSDSSGSSTSDGSSSSDSSSSTGGIEDISSGGGSSGDGSSTI